MAQPKPKKKRRSRSDPARRAAATRREETRRRAAEERQKEQEAAERRQKAIKTVRRLTLPVLVGLGVVFAAVFLFRPEKELAGVEKFPTGDIMAGLGYVLPPGLDTDTLPDPVCGRVEALTTDQLYSALWNGAVVLLHRPGDADTTRILEDLANRYESHVVVAPNDRITRPVLAVSWERRLSFAAATDPGVADFTGTYRERGRGSKACPLPAP